MISSEKHEVRPWVIIGNPENRRVSLFQRALISQGFEPATVLSYRDLLADTTVIETIPQQSVVRIESPGENFEVEKLLLSTGCEAAQREGVPFLDDRLLRQLTEDRGRILYPRQWYLGFVSTLERLFEYFSSRSDLRLTTSLRDIRILFDKTLCNTACGDKDIPVPKPLGKVSGFDELIGRMNETDVDRVFVKLANSSSASGVIAFRQKRNNSEAITSVELDRTNGTTHLYNSLKIRRYTNVEDIREIIDTLALHHVHVEAWLPKATIDRRVCDLRVVVIAGKPQHTVVRSSRSPLTNLHLGNRRGNLDVLLNNLSNAQLQALTTTCRRTADVFPDSHHLGLDILFTPGFKQHYLLEANAFGDLLPNVSHEGRNVYQAEIEAARAFTSCHLDAC